MIAAILTHVYLPQIAALPGTFGFIKPVGYVLLTPGIILWASAVVQLMMGFSRGRLETTGAYGVVRNPIYSSVTFFILPAVALLTLTRVYFVVSAFLYVGVMVFIGTEEGQLTKAFGREHEEYLARVDRLHLKNRDFQRLLSHVYLKQDAMEAFVTIGEPCTRVFAT